MINFINQKTIQNSNLNIFMQQNEPSIKEGIWIKKEGNYNKVYLDEKAISSDFLISDNQTNSLVPGDTLYAATYANGYIYIFGYNGDCYKYNVTTKEYTPISNIPDSTNAVSTCCTYIPELNKIFIANEVCYLYDIATDSYFLIPSPQTITFKNYCYYYNNYIYCLDYYVSSGSSITTNRICKKNLNTGEATVINFNTYNSRISYRIDNSIYIINSNGKVNMLNLVNDSIIELSNIVITGESPSNSYGLGGAFDQNSYVIDNKVYFMRDVKDAEYSLLSLDLDTYELKEIDITDAFNIISNNGGVTTPNAFVCDTDNKVFYLLNGHSVFLTLEFATAEYDENSIVVYTGTGYNTQLLNPPEMAIGRLLTSFKDAWHNTSTGLDKTSRFSLWRWYKMG